MRLASSAKKEWSMVFRSFDTSPVRGLSRPGRLCCAVKSLPISIHLRIRNGQSDAYAVSFNTFSAQRPRRYELFPRNVRGSTSFGLDVSQGTTRDVHEGTSSWSKCPRRYEIETSFGSESARIASPYRSDLVPARTLADGDVFGR